MSVLDTESKKLPLRKLLKKILLIGEGGVGKTTLIYRYINKEFLAKTKMTLGTDISIKEVVKIQENQENHLTMLIWDFAGQKRFQLMLKQFSRGAQIVILAFDLVQIQSLEKLNGWIKKLEDFGLWGNPKIDFFLVGMKKDLLNFQYLNPIPSEVIKDFQKKHSIKKYQETSAALNEGIDELFNEIAISMIEQEEKKLFKSIH